MLCHTDPEIIHKIALELIPRVGSISAKRLIAYCGGAKAVFEHSYRGLLQIPDIGKTVADAVVSQKKQVLEQAEKELRFMERYGIGAYYFSDDDYPYRLKQCEDGPVVFFTKTRSDINLNHNKIISIVGTRKATDYGREVCNQLVDRLVERGHKPIIVSGLAYGIDITAHRAALRNNLETIAVLGHGFNTIYPSSHRGVADKIQDSGALLTDFTSEALFDRKNFIRRNRIIAGLSDATIVIESAVEGGAMVTADIANSYNREVMAVPGNVWTKYSKGCNLLIKQNKAAMVETAEDIESLLGWDIERKTEKKQLTINFDSFSAEEQKILNFLEEKGEERVDLIAMGTGMAVSKVLSALLSLEFSGAVLSKPGKVFSIKK